MEIHCKEALKEALDLAYEHEDTTLRNILKRLMEREMNAQLDGEEMTIHIRRESGGKHCFLFSEVWANPNKYGLVGGIIFHGFPETGYKENFSVQLTPEYGWQMHT